MLLVMSITVRQGPTALAVGAGGGCLDIFTLIYPFFPFSPALWETARYGLKYCLKGLLNPKPTNQFPLLSPSSWEMVRYRLKYCVSKGLEALNNQQRLSERQMHINVPVSSKHLSQANTCIKEAHIDYPLT